MKELITSKHKQLLYKDELGDQFLLTKSLEIFQKSETILGCYCWSKKVFTQLQNEGVIHDFWKTDNKLYCFDVEVSNLPTLLSTGSHSRRVYQQGRWLKDKEKRLGHKIIQFNPKLQQ